MSVLVLHKCQETKTLVQELLTGPEVEDFLCERGDPAVCVEDALTDLKRYTV